MLRRLAALAAGAILTTGLAVTSATMANATTATCLGTQNPVSGPVSCGGLYLPGMDPAPSGQPNAGTLSLTASSDFWNALITFGPFTGSLSTQDFTVYERCTSVGGTRTETNPCGTGTPVLNAASGRPEFVAEVTPLGAHIGGALNSISNLCISWEALPVGPQHKLRIQMVERTCDTFGATFYAGIADGLNAPPANTGVPGAVTSPNPYQTFAAVPGGPCGTLSSCDVIANDALSSNFHNRLWVVDDQAFSYPAGRALLYPENDGRNQLAAFFGCNGAVLTTGVASSCP
jgi:hypothetical protein